MSNGFQVLVDSDAFVGRMYAEDAHHDRARQVFDDLHQERKPLVTTNLVVNEVATVLSFRRGQDLAIAFFRLVEEAKLPVIHITEELQQEAVEIFKEQHGRGTSVTDCANVAVIRRFNIPTIFSFDKVYSRDFGLQTATTND